MFLSLWCTSPPTLASQVKQLCADYRNQRLPQVPRKARNRRAGVLMFARLIQAASQSTLQARLPVCGLGRDQIRIAASLNPRQWLRANEKHSLDEKVDDSLLNTKDITPNDGETKVGGTDSLDAIQKGRSECLIANVSQTANAMNTKSKGVRHDKIGTALKHKKSIPNF